MQHSSGNLPRHNTARAFTLVELMVVMVIIAILISSVMVASSALIDRSRVTNTRAVLSLVQQAIEQFKRDKPPAFTKANNYDKRYGLFPPDELEVFSDVGFPNGPPRALARGEIVPAPDYPPMKFYTQGLDPVTELPQEHRDIAALYLAIELYSPDARAILSQIPDRNWSIEPLDPTSGDPAVYFDHNKNGSWEPTFDTQIRFILDDWGVPINYMAQRDWDPDAPSPFDPPGTASKNHLAWNEASTEIIRLNGGQPVLFSYGPDGKEQLAQEHMGSEALVSLVGDFEELAGDGRHRVDHPMNADNVYANPDLKAKLGEGIE